MKLTTKEHETAMDKLLKDKNIPVDKKLAMASKLVSDIIDKYNEQVKEKQG